MEGNLDDLEVRAFTGTRYIFWDKEGIHLNEVPDGNSRRTGRAAGVGPGCHMKTHWLEKKGLLKVGAISSYSERMACSVSMFGRDLFDGNSFDNCPIFFNLAR